MSDILQREDTGAITTLTLNDPATLNSLSDEMLAALSAQLSDIAQSPQKAVILRGTGKAFCAGHNLRQMQAMRQAPENSNNQWVERRGPERWAGGRQHNRLILTTWHSGLMGVVRQAYEH